MSAMQTITPSAPAAMPFWPRLLSAEQAAAYLGISRANLLERVAIHELPQPAKLGRRSLWDIRALDAFVDALTGFGEEQVGQDAADDKLFRL